VRIYSSHDIVAGSGIGEMRPPRQGVDRCTNHFTLQEAGRLSDEDARRLCWLDAFGALIANTDRHQYNVLFFAEGSRLRLAPAFDQVSVLYAPTGDGQVPPREFMLPHPAANTLDVWESARDAARQFWTQGSEDMRLSDDARLFCASNMKLFGK